MREVDKQQPQCRIEQCSLMLTLEEAVNWHGVITLSVTDG